MLYGGRILILLQQNGDIRAKSMKKSVYSIFISGILLLLTSCSQQYNIAGNSNLPVMDGRMLYLTISPDGTVRSNVDSCQVVHGRFSFQGDVDSVVWAQLCMGNENVMPVVLENGKVDIFVDNFGQRVKGSPLNNKLAEFWRKKERIDNDIWGVQQQYMRLIREGKSPQEVRKKLSSQTRKLSTRMQDLETKFVQDNYGNVLGTGFFMMICSQYPIPVLTAQIRKILDDAPTSFLCHPFVHNYILETRYVKENKRKR